MPPSLMRLSSYHLWSGTIATAFIDSVFLYLLSRLLPPPRFSQLFWPAGIAASLVFGAVWTWAMWSFAWSAVYQSVFPAWARYVLPPGFGLLYGALALGFWAVATRSRREPVVVFCVLGGLISIPGHLVGAARGLFTVPLLRDVSVVSALTFGFFEFVFYFATILAAAIVRAAWDHMIQKRERARRAIA